MGIEDFDAPKEGDRLYWIRLTNKVFNTGFNLCNNQCRAGSENMLQPCFNHCYNHYMIQKKKVMHQQQEADEYNFMKCLSKSDEPESLETMLKCSANNHADKMLIAADNIEKY